MNQPTKEAVRDDYSLFFAALVLVGLGLASALEGSVPGFIAGLGTAWVIAICLLTQGWAR
jgi:hypothetical protein